MEEELQPFPNIEPEESHAQLLVQGNCASAQFETVKKIIENIGITVLEVEQVSPAFTLLKLSSRDMREIALRLTQKGVFNFTGINALSTKG
jgi:hypothetical protein